MPVKIRRHLLNVVGGSQEQEAKKRGRQRGDAGLQEGYCMCERKTKRLGISDEVGFTRALTSRTGDHIQFFKSPYSLPNCKRGVFHTYPSMFLSW